jgi:phosphotransferase system HPr (HPr) family protein
MTEREVKIVNRLGLHARAAAKLVHLAGRYACRITLERDGERVDAKSILGILLLAAAQGTRVRLCCDGPDENEAMTAVCDLIARRFDEGE